MTSILKSPPARAASPASLEQPFPMAPPSTEACCGPASLPPSPCEARAGYRIEPFVDGFLETAVGPVPRLRHRLNWRDRLGTLRVRSGIGRNHYSIAPGLYALGAPDADAPVLVTANYKLTVDLLRTRLSGCHAWLLVVDSRGINVWCAAGKGTFGTREIVRRVHACGVDKVVSHRRLIVPQLGATGVQARNVRKNTGFEVIWGPIRAEDIPRFLDNGGRAEEHMRRVTFTLRERAVLIPVELSFLPKPSLWIVLAALALSALGPQWVSLSAGWQRGLLLVGVYGTGIAAGVGLMPLLLPWIPGRAFAFKGILCGLLTNTLLVAFLRSALNPWEMAAILLFGSAVASYLAMNFTGATPFTSPSGVAKEMRRYIPIQAMAVLLAAGLWVVGAFAA